MWWQRGRALISVSDKREVLGLGRVLSEELKMEIIATGGTYESLRQGGFDMQRLLSVEQITGFPAILNGRVKSLHPALFGGVLAPTGVFQRPPSLPIFDPLLPPSSSSEAAASALSGSSSSSPLVAGECDVHDHDESWYLPAEEREKVAAELAGHGLAPIQLVVCNLYDFKGQPSIETIDIGGVALLRAAAKNYHHVIVLSDPDDYQWVSRSLLRSFHHLSTPSSSHPPSYIPPLTLQQRKHLALKAFKLTAEFDAKIVDWFQSSSSSSSSSSSTSTTSSSTTSSSSPASSSSSSSSTSTSPAVSLLPGQFNFKAEKIQTLRYGENPHQEAAVYRLQESEQQTEKAIGEGEEQLGAFIALPGGREISYNNILDVESAWDIITEWHEERSASSKNLVVAIVKHNTPCGVAMTRVATPAPAASSPTTSSSAAPTPPSSWTLETEVQDQQGKVQTVSQAAVETYKKALASDPISAFGGIMAINTTVDLALVQAIDKLFLEVIVALDFTPEALEWLATKKKNCRLLRFNPTAPLRSYSFRSTRSGILVQSLDRDFPLSSSSSSSSSSPSTSSSTPSSSTPPASRKWKPIGWKTMTKKQVEGEQQQRDLEFAWRVAKYVRSNGIVLAKDGATVGIGGGQPNRVSSVELAIKFAGKRAQGAVLASDAMFPFPDSIQVAAQAGVAAIVQSGGSIRDADVIDSADRFNLPMIFTARRHFRH